VNRRHIWQKQIVPMLNKLRYECAPLLKSQAPWHDAGAHALAQSYDELATKSGGLDFSTDGPTSVRGILYDHRQEMQAAFGLYFDDYPGGLRFTVLPKLGMLWRYEEEQKRTNNALVRTAEMTQQAIRASGTTVEAALFKAVDKQYQVLVEQAGRLRETTQQLFARPGTEPPPAALPKVERR